MICERCGKSTKVRRKRCVKCYKMLCRKCAVVLPGRRYRCEFGCKPKKSTPSSVKAVLEVEREVWGERVLFGEANAGWRFAPQDTPDDAPVFLNAFEALTHGTGTVVHRVACIPSPTPPPIYKVWSAQAYPLISALAKMAARDVLPLWQPPEFVVDAITGEAPGALKRSVNLCTEVIQKEDPQNPTPRGLAASATGRALQVIYGEVPMPGAGLYNAPALLAMNAHRSQEKANNYHLFLLQSLAEMAYKEA